MPEVRITLDEQLLRSIDATVRRCGTTRSAFAREALRAAVRSGRHAALDRKHREGYARKPVKRGEFNDWEAEQVWGER